MVYMTVKQSPIYHQMTLEEFLFQSYTHSPIINANTTNTRTYEAEQIGERFSRVFDSAELIGKLAEFNTSTDHLREKNREELYTTFHIPKRSGGLRRIDAPVPELMEALRNLRVALKAHLYVKIKK